jgi:hypothetical protein
MRRITRGFVLPVAVLVIAFAVAGCTSSVKSAIGSATSAAASVVNSVTSDPTATVTPTPTPTPTPTDTVTPTVVPSTATATVTETATAAAPSASPSATTSPAESTGKKLLWLWVVLGVVALALLIGLITWIAHAGRRRSEAAAGWQSRVIDAYAKGSALHDAMGVAENPGGPASQGAQARWYDIQRRADDLNQTLYGLREAARDPSDQARIEDVLVSLQAVRSAMEAERAPGAYIGQQSDVVRSRLYAFELSLQALRAGDPRYS